MAGSLQMRDGVHELGITWHKTGSSNSVKGIWVMRLLFFLLFYVFQVADNGVRQLVS